jgi:transmembrane sensor
VKAPIPPDIPYSEAQRKEAADWFVIIHAEDQPTSETLQAWLRWLDQHKGNRAAFTAIAQAWHGTPASAALPMPSAEELASDTYDGEQTVAEWIAEHADDTAHLNRPGRQAEVRSPRLRRWASLAAAILVAVAVGSIMMMRYFGSQGSQSDVFSTKAGEQIEITLADGSRVWLGPKSLLRVDFTTMRRGIQLTAGEAFFSVRKNHERPFVVRSAGGDITAVGTAFNVRAVSDHVTVSVLEGVVTVAPTSLLMAPQPDIVRVASGQQLTFTARESIKSLKIASSPSPGERARWRDGVLIYRDEPLRDVVMDVARYSQKRFEITGDATGELRYTGVVYQKAVDEWASALPESFPVNVVIQGDKTIISLR